MSYNPIPGEQTIEDTRINLISNIEIESLDPHRNEGLVNHIKKFKICCWVLIALAIPFPIIGWYSDTTFHIIFYESWIFLIVQILLGLAGLRAVREDIFRRLEQYQKFINIYFLVFLGFIVINEAIVTWVVVRHNKDNCNDFSYYKVCNDRWGILDKQMILILYYPTIDLAIFIIYRYYLQVVVGFNKFASATRIVGIN